MLTMDHVRVYRNQDLSELKVDLHVDETTRVMYVDHPINGFYRFGVANSKDIIELSSPDIDVRNLWMKKLAYVAGKKSGLGEHIMRVGSETDYKNVGKWESVVVADSVSRSTGLLVFQNVQTEVPYRFTGTPQPQQHLTVVADNDPHFASFLPFENWRQAFEADVIAAEEEAKKIEELKAQGYKIPDPSLRDRSRDYLVDRVVASNVESSSTTFCNRLLEGIVQLLAMAEHQLALKYKLASASQQNLAVISSTAKAEEAVNPIDDNLSKPSLGIAESVQDIADARLLVMTPKPSEDTPLPAEDDIPLFIQADLLSALGSLRGLILSYRFDNKPENAEQLRCIRRLSVHHLQKSLYKVLKALEEMQKQTIEKVMRELEHQINQVTAEGGSAQIKEQAEAKATEQLEKLTAKFIELPVAAVEEEEREGRKKTGDVDESDSDQGKGEGESTEAECDVAPEGKKEGEGAHEREWEEVTRSKSMDEQETKGGEAEKGKKGSDVASAEVEEQLDLHTTKSVGLPALAAEQGGLMRVDLSDEPKEGQEGQEGEGEGESEALRKSESEDKHRGGREGERGECKVHFEDQDKPERESMDKDKQEQPEGPDEDLDEDQGEDREKRTDQGEEGVKGEKTQQKVPKVATKDPQVPPEDMPSPSDTPYERGVKVRKAAQRQLRSILRPLLSRDFLHLDVAPLVADFMRKNETNLEQLADLAEEVAATFGDTTQQFVQKKTTEVEEMIVTQLDKLTETIAEFAEAAPTPEEMSDLVKGKMKQGLQDVMGKLDDPSLQLEEPSSFPTTEREVMVRLARVKAEVDRKILEITTEHGAEWDGNYSTLVEMVLLEQTDQLWTQLQDAVRLCISKSIYALLYLTGSGLKTPPGHHFTHTNQNAPSPPPSPKVPAPSSGYFF